MLQTHWFKSLFHNKHRPGLLAALALGVLSGCASPVASPDRPQASIWDLSLYQGHDRWWMPYFNAIQPFGSVKATTPDLPLVRLPLTQIHEGWAWLRDYDFDCDLAIDADEMTQAWLIRAAEIKTGNIYGPYALIAPTQLANLHLAESGMIRLTGLSLPRQERRLVRATIERDPAGQTFTAELSAFMEHVAENMQRDRSDAPVEIAKTPSETLSTPASGSEDPGGSAPPGQGGTPPGQGGEVPDPPVDPPGQGEDPPGGGPPGGGPPGGGKPDKKSEQDYLPLPPACIAETRLRILQGRKMPDDL